VSRSGLLPVTVAAVAAVALPGPATAAAACQPGVGIRLAEVPSGSRDPRAASYVIDHVKPGATFTRRIEVCNGTSSPTRLQLYPNAAVVERGSFTIVEGRARNELTGWISVTPSAVSLAPGQRATATATFAVPADAEPGERYAVVLAELPARRGTSGVAVAGRVGVRVYLDVGDAGAPRSDFRVDTLQAGRTTDGSPVVTARVHNTGGRALDLTGALSLTDGPGGLSGGPFPAKLGTTLAPGDTEPVTIPLDKAISGGPWTATLTLRSGLLERRARAVITFPSGAGATAPPVEADALPLAKDRTFLGWVAGSLIGLLFLLLLVIGLLTSRRKAREKQAQ
jgi:hypothetical protein